MKRSLCNALKQDFFACITGIHNLLKQVRMQLTEPQTVFKMLVHCLMGSILPQKYLHKSRIILPLLRLVITITKLQSFEFTNIGNGSVVGLVLHFLIYLPTELSPSPLYFLFTTFKICPQLLGHIYWL